MQLCTQCYWEGAAHGACPQCGSAQWVNSASPMGKRIKAEMAKADKAARQALGRQRVDHMHPPPPPAPPPYPYPPPQAPAAYRQPAPKKRGVSWFRITFLVAAIVAPLWGLKACADSCAESVDKASDRRATERLERVQRTAKDRRNYAVVLQDDARNRGIDLIAETSGTYNTTLKVTWRGCSGRAFVTGETNILAELYGLDFQRFECRRPGGPVFVTEL